MLFDGWCFGMRWGRPRSSRGYVGARHEAKVLPALGQATKRRRPRQSNQEIDNSIVFVAESTRMSRALDTDTRPLSSEICRKMPAWHLISGEMQQKIPRQVM